jgi:acyl carrier protein
MQRPSDPEILDEIGRALGDLGVIASPLQPSTPLFEGGLELDSFTLVELLGRVEERFGVSFRDDDFTPERFTLGGIVALVTERLEADA